MRRSLKAAIDRYCTGRAISRNNFLAIALHEYLECYSPGSPLENLLLKDLLGGQGDRVLFTYTLQTSLHGTALKWCASRSASLAQVIRASLVWQLIPNEAPVNWAVSYGKHDIAWFLDKSDAQLFIRHRPNGEKLRLRQGGRYAR